MRYKIHVLDRKYEKWEVYDAVTLQLTKIDINPIEHKLFNHDVFSINSENISIEHSVIRSIPGIQGVLVLEGDKTYGKIKKKFLYRCIPDDRRLPEFLIPYKPKIVFNKKMHNNYIIFKFKNWNNKHPLGTMTQRIGPVNNLGNFYEYQLYCKSLYASIQQFTKDTMKALREKSSDFYINNIIEKYELEDRRDWKVYSIDPHDCRDLDDAFSIKKIDDKILLSIYIANVSLWLDIMSLWGSFSQRIATIYLPDRKRPMLPTILSEALCSLLEKNTRFAFTLDITIKDNIILDTVFKNTSIVLKKNHAYETKELLSSKFYKLLFELTTKMNSIKGQQYVSKIKDSHDIIAYLMVLMNFISGKKLNSFNSGIFRSVRLNNNKKIPKVLPDGVLKFIKGWNSSGGVYVGHNNKYRNHDLLNIESYVHITSPIRRLVDLLNMLELQDKLGLFKYNKESKKFYDKWYSNLDYINSTMRSIRKVQNDSSLLNVCINNINNEYDGFLFDKMKRNDGLFQYMVFLPKIKLINRLVVKEEYENYTKHLFKVYVFIDEDRLKQKIRVDILSSYNIYVK